MSILDNLFTFLAETPPQGQVPLIGVTLTSTSLQSLAATINTGGNSGGTAGFQYSPPNWVKVGPAKMETGASVSLDLLAFKCTLNVPTKPTPSQVATVVLSKNIPIAGAQSGPYTMAVTFPWGKVESEANVNSASGVVYGSQGNQFVTLVLSTSWTPAPPIIK